MIQSRKPINPKEHERVALRCYTALDLFVKGMARREEWYDAADSTNVVEQLIEMGRVDGGNMLYVAKAIDGLADAMQLPCGRMQLTGDELYALRNVVTIYDDMLGKLSQGTIAEAQAAVVMKICQQRENPDNGVRVIE